MYIDISIDEILKKFIDNYEEKEVIGWTATAAGNGIHIEYEDKVLTWKDYEAIASDIYDTCFNDNEDVEPVIQYYENKYDITIPVIETTTSNKLKKLLIPKQTSKDKNLKIKMVINKPVK